MSEKLIPLDKRRHLFKSTTYGQWIEEGFDLTEALEQIDGPIIEIGGPTSCGYPYLLPGMEYANRLPTGQQILMSNVDLKYLLKTDYPDADMDTIKYLRRVYRKNYRGKLDLKCDGTNMPFSDESVGAVLFSSLPYSFTFNAREGTIRESARVLKPGGLLIAQGPLIGEIELAESLGFVKKMHFAMDTVGHCYDVVMVSTKVEIYYKE